MDMSFIMNNLHFFIIGLVVILFLILIISKLGNKKSSDDEISILDVTEDGVPNSLDERDFEYGYEKEKTIVMNPIDIDEEKKDGEI